MGDHHTASGDACQSKRTPSRATPSTSTTSFRLLVAASMARSRGARRIANHFLLASRTPDLGAQGSEQMQMCTQASKFGRVSSHAHTNEHSLSVDELILVSVVPVATCLSGKNRLAALFIPLIFISCCVGSSPGRRVAGSVADSDSSPDRARERNVASLEITIDTASHISSPNRLDGQRCVLSSPCR